jgi:hypothetical protein
LPRRQSGERGSRENIFRMAVKLLAHAPEEPSKRDADVSTNARHSLGLLLDVCGK